MELLRRVIETQTEAMQTPVAEREVASVPESSRVPTYAKQLLDEALAQKMLEVAEYRGDHHDRMVNVLPQGIAPEGVLVTQPKIRESLKEVMDGWMAV